jgi:saccharopine dehydrogenase (NADP+, L-glutamate forming)
MKQQVLIWGAGMVAPPLVQYLLQLPDLEVVLADLDKSKAEVLVAQSEQGHALALSIDETERALKKIRQSDLVISLLPFEFHPRVAELCIQTGTDLITASYTSPQMQKLEPDIRKARILVLNEVGLDPGIDHMEAMRIIHSIQEKQGRILSFTSFCGGLPAPEANTNPLGYKFSWSPKGVLAASKSPARYLSQGDIIQVEPADLFNSPLSLEFVEIGRLEGYPNRDSLPYVSLYGIPSVQTMIRGTLRYPGWCAFMHAAVEIGLLRDTFEIIEEKDAWCDLILRLLGQSPDKDIRSALRTCLGEDLFRKSLPGFEELGLLDCEPISRRAESVLEALAIRMQERLQFKENERDMIVLRHRFNAEYPNGTRENITSTLIDFGKQGGHSAMARTVGLPVAVAAKLVLQGKSKLTGLHIPIQKELYQPILEALTRFDIQFHVESIG